METLKPSTRILLLVLGWVAVLAGFVGLFLPFLQGFLMLAFGAAALSLVSSTMLNVLRALLRPWPAGWQALLRMRRRLLRYLS